MRARTWTTGLRWILVVVMAALTWRYLRSIGWSELIERARSAMPGPLLVAIAALVSRHLLLYGRWIQCLKLLPTRPAYGFLLAAQLAGIFVNHATPTARLLGGVLRARYFACKHPVRFADAYGVVLVDQTAHQTLQGLLTWLALAVLAWNLDRRSVAVGLAVALVLPFTAIPFWCIRSKRGAAVPLEWWWARWSVRCAARIGTVVDSGRRIFVLLGRGWTHPSLQLRLAAFAIGTLGVSALAQWLVFRSLDDEVGFLTTLVVVSVGVAAGVMTGTPGGLATTEAAMIAGYVALGQSPVDAVAGTLLFRGLHYAVVLALGLPALVYCEWVTRDRFRGRDQTGQSEPQAGDRLDVGSRPDPVASERRPGPGSLHQR